MRGIEARIGISYTRIVSAYLFFSGVMILPLLGVLLNRVAHVPSSRSDFLIALISYGNIAVATLSLIFAMMLLRQPLSIGFGGWMPISVTGATLALTSPNGAFAIVVAAIAIRLSSALAGENVSASITAALALIGWSIAGLADNTLTLLVGVGFSDLCVAWRDLQRRGNVAATDFFTNTLSVFFLVMSFAAAGTRANTSQFIAHALTDWSVVFAFAAIAIRVGFVFVSNRMDTASWNIGVWLVLARLPTIMTNPVPNWFLFWAVLSAAVFAVRCFAESDAERRTNFASATAKSLATLSVVTNDVTVVCAASIAWMIGDALARHNDNDSPLMNVRRWLAAAIWLGVPLTAGFVGRVGVVSQLAQRGWAGIVVLSLSLLALGIGVSALLSGESRGHIRSALSDRQNRRFIGSVIVLAFAAILFGAFTTLYANTTLTQMLSRDITLNGSAFLVSVALCVAFWRAAPRLQDRLRPAFDRASRALAFEEWGDTVAGAFARMGSPFKHVFTFFEADGTVIWAIIVVMLLILTTRGITP
jgi:hypothetical protein